MNLPIDIQVSSGSLNEISEALRGSEKLIEKSVASAIKTTINRVKREAARELAKVTGLQLKVLNKRLYIGFRAKGTYGSVWIGLNPISLSKLNPKKTSRGVRAGKVNVAGGFIPGGSRGQNVFVRDDRDRLPINKVVYNIAPKAEVAIINKLQPVILRIFEQELRSQLLKIYG